MSSELYSVVFSGEIKEGTSLDEVQDRLVAIFKMPPEKVKKIFTGRPITIKNNIELQVAQKYQRAFDAAGAVCEIRKILKKTEAPVETSNVTTQNTSPSVAVTKPSSAAQNISKPSNSKLNLAGFWRRIFAFLIDSILLGIVGASLGFFFFDEFAKLGQSGRLIGFVIAILYFGLLNSSIGNGQTIGKRLLKIKVISAVDDSLISLPKSAWRYLVLALPFYCNNLILPIENQILMILLALVVFGMGGLLFYLYIFNRKTRQSLHDLAAKTLVVQNIEGGRQYQSGVWKGHFVAAATLIVLIVGGGLLGVPILAKTGTFPEMLSLQHELMGKPDINAASVVAGTTYSGAGETNFTAVTIVVSDEQMMSEDVAGDIVLSTFSFCPSSKDKNLLKVTITYGYDIGISTGWKNSNFIYTPAQWASKLKLSST